MAKVKVYPAEGYGAHKRSVELISTRLETLTTTTQAGTVVAADATDLATAITLVNELRAIAIANGQAAAA